MSSNLKTVKVIFEDSKYNYSTSVNGQVSDEDIRKYFVGVWLNLGSGENDNMQKCIGCEVI